MWNTNIWLSGQSAHPQYANKLILETAEKTEDYTLTLDDADKIVLMNKIAAGILTVPNNDTQDFTIGSIVGVYNASSVLLTIEGNHASYSGTPTGAVGTVTITADNDGEAGNVTLTGDGTDDIDDLVLAHNTANPTNALTVDAGGTEVPENTAEVELTGGVTIRNSGDLEQYGEISLRKRAANEWVLAGSVS